MTVRAVLWTYKSRKDGTCNVKIYWQHAGHKGYIKTEYYFSPKDWDDHKGVLKRTHPLHAVVNSRLQGDIIQLQASILNGDTPSQRKPKSKSLISFVNGYIQEAKSGLHNIAPGTCRQYASHLTRLQQYCRHAGLPELTFHDINNDFYLAFSAFLQTVGCQAPGVGKHIKLLKKFMNEALERGLHTNTAHQGKSFRSHRDNLTDKVYLTSDEIEAFACVNLTDKPDLQREQDRFMVSYYLLLRYSDSVSLQPDKIVEKQGKRFYLNIAQKTGKPSYIPVKPAAWDIIQRNGFDLSGDSNQEANRKLKTIAAMAGIDTPVNNGLKTGPKWMFVSTHTARRSAATNLLLAGADIKVIAQLGGWTSEKSLRAYLLASGLDLAELASSLGFFE